MGLFRSKSKNVFLSYAHRYRDKAGELALSLRMRGHTVFLDQTNLQAGQSFDDKIYDAVRNADALVFLISPESVRPNSYALSELNVAISNWPNPSGRVLPVMVAPTPDEQIPSYLRAVHILKPKGNLVFEVGNAVDQLSGSSRRRWLPRLPSLPQVDFARMFKSRKVFIAHSRENAGHAENLSMALRMQGHDVLWDGTSSMPGQSYDVIAQQAIMAADTFVFLISPDSVRSGSRAQGELALAMQKWPDPTGHVLPVAVARTQTSDIPSYLRHCQIVAPRANVGLEVSSAMSQMGGRKLPIPLPLILGALGGVVAGWFTPDLMYDAAKAIGVALAAITGLGILLTGRYTTRQAAVAAFTIALGGFVAGNFGWFDEYVMETPFPYVMVNFVSGAIFGFFTQLALAMTIPNLRHGLPWILIPLATAFCWQTWTTEAGGTVWPLWAAGLSAWIGYGIAQRKIPGR